MIHCSRTAHLHDIALGWSRRQQWYWNYWYLFAAGQSDSSIIVTIALKDNSCGQVILMQLTSLSWKRVNSVLVIVVDETGAKKRGLHAQACDLLSRAKSWIGFSIFSMYGGFLFIISCPYDCTGNHWRTKWPTKWVTQHKLKVWINRGGSRQMTDCL